VSEAVAPTWEFLTKHAQVLVCIARDPGIRLREIAEEVGMTERAAYRNVAQLSEAGYLTRMREGRRNRYTINAQLPIPDAVAHEQSIGELLKIVTAAPRPTSKRQPAGATPKR
jgi:DNA-binding IclR family transcriptional regulator